MENEQKKSDNHNYFRYIIAVVLLFAIINFTMRSCGGSDAGTAELHQRTDAAVDAVEKEHATAGSELDATGRQLDSAGTAISRADELIGRSQERVNQNAASIDECQRIVGECRKIIADCNRIYAEAEKANRSGTGCGGGS